MDIKNAVSTAKRFFTETYEPNEIADLMLEEIEHSDGHWLITLGFRRATLENILGDEKEGRVYKTISIDDQTGSVESMKIRPI